MRMLRMRSDARRHEALGSPRHAESTECEAVDPGAFAVHRFTVRDSIPRFSGPGQRGAHDAIARLLTEFNALPRRS